MMVGMADDQRERSYSAADIAADTAVDTAAQIMLRRHRPSEALLSRRPMYDLTKRATAPDLLTEFLTSEGSMVTSSCIRSDSEEELRLTNIVRHFTDSCSISSRGSPVPSDMDEPDDGLYMPSLDPIGETATAPSTPPPEPMPAYAPKSHMIIRCSSAPAMLNSALNRQLKPDQSKDVSKDDSCVGRRSTDCTPTTTPYNTPIASPRVKRAAEVSPHRTPLIRIKRFSEVLPPPNYSRAAIKRDSLPVETLFVNPASTATNPQPVHVPAPVHNLIQGLYSRSSAQEESFNPLPIPQRTPELKLRRNTSVPTRLSSFNNVHRMFSGPDHNRRKMASSTDVRDTVSRLAAGGKQQEPVTTEQPTSHTITEWITSGDLKKKVKKSDLNVFAPISM